MAFSRVIWIVLDSVGIGEMPDAAQYGDAGSDTLGNIARMRGIKLPNLARLGLGNIMPLTGIGPAAAPAGAYGKCTLASPGKDTSNALPSAALSFTSKPTSIAGEVLSSYSTSASASADWQSRHQFTGL